MTPSACPHPDSVHVRCQRSTDTRSSHGPDSYGDCYSEVTMAENEKDLNKIK